MKDFIIFCLIILTGIIGLYTWFNHMRSERLIYERKEFILRTHLYSEASRQRFLDQVTEEDFKAEVIKRLGPEPIYEYNIDLSPWKFHLNGKKENEKNNRSRKSSQNRDE